MKRFVFAAISVAAGLFVGLACLEMLAIGWVVLKDGHYTPAPLLFERLQNTYVRSATEGTGCTYADTLFPHPYVGFVHHDQPPCGHWHVNNVGLNGEDFPTVKRDDRYVILLTGGSVAGQLGQTAPPPAPRYLEVALNEHYVSPNGLPFLVLNGGDGAWKQPQQLILFSLYSNVVDAVVTLDGYNEVLMMTPLASGRLETPAINFLEVNPVAAQDGFDNVVMSWMAGRVAGMMMRSSVLSRSHAAYLALLAVKQMTKADGTFRAQNPEQFGRMFALPVAMRGDATAVIDFQLAQYRRYITLMDAIARREGVKELFFIQPVPAIGKTLSEAERQVNPNLGYADRYRKLVSSLESLNDQGIPVVNLLDVFAGQTGTIYVDDIHFARGPKGESVGYTLVAERMAREIAKRWGLKPKEKE
ncbi:MAG: hypothetical protein ISP49_18815 [Reyranella sp.]|nr:hypothetical protein [Reyranella sp.]